MGICDTILVLLKDTLIPKAKGGESKVFYQKMMADYYRYIAEFRDGEKGCRSRECSQGLRRRSSSCREGPCRHPPYPSGSCLELLCLPVRSLATARRSMQDGSNRL